MGISMALAGVTGILGTVIFTHLRRRIGLERTGLIAYSAEILCLSLCVASVWAPGSPFDPYQSQTVNCTTVESTQNPSTVSPLLNLANATVARRGIRDVSHRYIPVADSGEVMIGSEYFLSRELIRLPDARNSELHRYRRSINSDDETSTEDGQEKEEPDCNEYVYSFDGINVSIILFLLGIVTSRVGE